MHVLVVEDDLAMQELLATLLRGVDSQVHVHRADTLSTALTLWQQYPIDLVLCDWNLPNQENGLTLVKAIRQKSSELPIVMITGRGDRATVTRSLQHKVNEFIVKPFDPAAVMERLERYFTSGSTASAEQSPDKKNTPSLDEFVRDVEGVLSRLTIMPGAETALTSITQEDHPSAQELAQQWQNDPAITTRLLWLANSSLMRRSGGALTTLREAIAAVGVDMALTQVLALSLADTSRLQHPKLKSLSKTFTEQAQKLAEYAAILAKQLKLDVVTCYTAGLMVRLGDCALLEAIQLYFDSGGEASDEEIESVLNQYAARYGNQLKMKWRLPLALRERIGATYSTSSGQVNPELLLMRLAACMISEKGHSDGLEKLCRRLGLRPADLPGGE